jgi:TonB-dependent starch-binding outer membrane protein SusC
MRFLAWLVLTVCTIPLFFGFVGYRTIKLKGRIMNMHKVPLQGAVIKLKDKHLFTKSDVYGRFNINVENNDTLLVDYVGYNTKMIGVGKLQHLEVILVENNRSLNDVLVK